jgi:hypothetical protein
MTKDIVSPDTRTKSMNIAPVNDANIDSCRHDHLDHPTRDFWRHK